MEREKNYTAFGLTFVIFDSKYKYKRGFCYKRTSLTHPIPNFKEHEFSAELIYYKAESQGITNTPKKIPFYENKHKEEF